MKRFEGKVALVTGAASGIGKATAARLADEGAKVAGIDINGDVEFRCDVSDEAQVIATVAAVVAKFDRLDVVANVAGILRADHTHELSLEHWRRVLDINLTGTFLVCRAAIPHLLKTRGNIVNMASTAAIAGHPWMAAYSASKGGLLSLTRALAAEYVKQKIRVNAVLPGGIDTPMHGDFAVPEGGDPTILVHLTPLVRYVGPEYAASVVAFLASDDGRYINGAAIRVDGGMFT